MAMMQPPAEATPREARKGTASFHLARPTARGESDDPSFKRGRDEKSARRALSVFPWAFAAQERRVRVNWPPESEVQLSCEGVTRAQLTRDCVLRTSDVRLISNSRSDLCT